jgi:SsrA-binding protein
MAKQPAKPNTKPTLQNRQAGFQYALQERFTAGLMLTGSEVKSIRAGKVQLQDAYCYLTAAGELFVRNLHIAPYENGGYANHTATRERKLLLTAKELAKLEKALRDTGTTIVPTKVFFNDRNLAKLEIALARGKKLHDKRESIKERDVEREIKRRTG